MIYNKLPLWHLFCVYTKTETDVFYNPLIKGKKMEQFHKLAKMKTLLVDDDQLIRNVMQRAFVENGCSLQTTDSAEEGLRALEKKRFDIIISDFELPGINGLEFFKQIVVCQPDTVKILISGYVDPDVISQAYGIGVHFFLQKPLLFMTLFETLIQQIEKRDRENKTDAKDRGQNGSCRKVKYYQRKSFAC
jgi:DNA-binding NtrC family response regulator